MDNINISNVIDIIMNEHKSFYDIQVLMDYLSLLPFFKNMYQKDKISIKKMAENLTIKRYNSDDIIFSKGDDSNELFIILSGKVRVLINKTSKELMNNSIKVINLPSEEEVNTKGSRSYFTKKFIKSNISNELIIGEEGGYLYSKIKEIAVLSEGTVFGELGLRDNKKRSAFCIAKTDCILVSLSKDIYNRCIRVYCYIIILINRILKTKRLKNY